jgi:hypothetical protein
MRDSGFSQKSCGMNPQEKMESDQWFTSPMRVNGINFEVDIMIENRRKTITKGISSNALMHSRRSSEFNPLTRDPARHCRIQKNSRAARAPANWLNQGIA